MPWNNLPKSMWSNMEKCVSDVQKEGHDKQSAIAICYSSIMKGKELSETLKSFRLKAAPNYHITQKASDNPSDYLIVEDKNAPTTWHLQVKKNGKPDHGLMGSAWAALHQGFRGNKYEGPNKQAAIDKLKKMYDAEQMPVPSEKEITVKSIMDAPNLRGDDVQRCLNCKYAQAIVTDDMAMPTAADSAMTMMETHKDMCEGLICTQFDFLTEPDFVCDGYESIPPELVTMKQADGKYRWFMFSSSSYEDRDNQIVSQKALEDDTARMNETGDFGGIGWWHLWILDGKPVNFKELSNEEKLRAHPWMFGECDFSQMLGRISIESGTFDYDWIGEMFATQKGLGASREFFNPPPKDGVFDKIITFSRAILPEPHASNRLTLFGVSAKEKNMNALDKFKDLIKKAGDTPEAKEKVEGLLQAAEKLDKTAEQAGLTAKENQAEPVTELKPTEPKPAVFTGDMPIDEFKQLLDEAVTKFLTPAVKEIGTQVAKMNEAQQVTAKESSDKLSATIKSQQDILTDVSARLAALEGLKPRAYRATDDPTNVTTKEAVAAKTPKGDKQVEDNLEKWLTS